MFKNYNPGVTFFEIPTVPICENLHCAIHHCRRRFPCGATGESLVLRNRRPQDGYASRHQESPDPQYGG